MWPRFAVNADREVLRLGRALRAGHWRHGPYRLLRVLDPKRRLVAAASVRDRVVHHALHRVLAPRYNARFIHHSYGCLPARGMHRAVMAFQAHARRFRWVLCLDIRRYFYRMERTRLRNLLVRAFPEPQLAPVLDEVLASGAGLYRRRDVVQWRGWEAPGEPGRGLPIGNLTSQWWGNVYLDGLDHHVLRELRPGAYQRYMDDATLFGRSRTGLLRARDAVASWLHAERGPGAQRPQCTAHPDAAAAHVPGLPRRPPSPYPR